MTEVQKQIRAEVMEEARQSLEDYLKKLLKCGCSIEVAARIIEETMPVIGALVDEKIAARQPREPGEPLH
jgi:hypothetical protein